MDSPSPSPTRSPPTSHHPFPLPSPCFLIAPPPSRILQFIRHDGAEFFETYDYGESDGPSQTHGNSERQHVPDFSVTEQLKMNKNTLFTHFSVRTFTTCHLYIYTEYACAHTSV